MNNTVDQRRTTVKIYVNNPITVVAIFLWIGFVGAISFMEAWLKFQAPGVTLPIGLGIGRLVFGVLNKVEWVFALVVLTSTLVKKERGFNWHYLFFIIPFLILVLQTVWLLPALDTRAALHIEGEHVSSSNLHFYYVGAEILKVIGLAVFGINQFRSKGRLNM